MPRWDYACDGLSVQHRSASSAAGAQGSVAEKFSDSSPQHLNLCSGSSATVPTAPSTRASGAQHADAAAAPPGHWVMASAVFEGTSLVNMFVRDCWVNGVRRLVISQRGEEEEFFEIRTEWSDRNILYLHRSYSDLGRLLKRLLESFPEDRRDLSKSPLLEGQSTKGVQTNRGVARTLGAYCTWGSPWRTI